MVLPNIYSRRKRQAEAGSIDVFEYDAISQKVRVQLFMNMNAALVSVCDKLDYLQEEAYGLISDVMREELGMPQLYPGYSRTRGEELESYFVNTADTDHVLDVLELWHRISLHYCEMRGNDPDVIKLYVLRINARFREAGVGFEIVDGQIIQKSNDFLHEEAVLPSLHILSEKRFESANKEFREAHHAYRAGEYEDCLTDCLKAFESVMKVIAAERGWEVSSNATAKTLIAALYEHEFVPSYMQNQFSSLRTMLESSVPTTRNKSAGHGAGDRPRNVPANLAEFQLHQTAAIIVFLASLD